MANFREILNDMADLLEKKDRAYGGANTRTARIMEVLYPNGIQPEEYVQVLAITRIVDKLCRQSVTDDPENWKDILGYCACLLALYAHEEEPEQPYTPGPPVSVSVFLNGERVPGVSGEVKYSPGRSSREDDAEGCHCPYHDIEGLR